MPYVDHDTDDDESVGEPIQWNGSSRTPKKRKRSKFKRFQFSNEHPLVHSHHIRQCPDTERKIPNFVGGLLPRMDKGDREYYCLTMLTLFKPWRSGKDLRLDASITWDTEFRQSEFSPQHLKIMANFNLRYECLDARDNYRAELMQGAEDGLPSWLDGYKLDSL
ncbi:hypothetical protein IW262DRAFT_1277859, partial [Armillaria fumosa]